MENDEAVKRLLSRLNQYFAAPGITEAADRPARETDNIELLETRIEELILRYQRSLDAVESLANGSFSFFMENQHDIPAQIKILQTRLSHLIWQTRQIAEHVPSETDNSPGASPVQTGDSALSAAEDRAKKQNRDFFEEFSSFYANTAGALEECRKIGKALSEKNRQQDILINTIPAYIYFKDTELRYLLVNNSYASLIGLTPEELIGKNDKELPFDESVNIYETIDRSIIKSGTAQSNIVKQHITRDGRPYWSSTSKVPYFDENGKVAGIIGIVTDITEQKNAELALVESEKKYRLIADNTLDVIWIIDLASMCFTYVSPSVYAMRGYTPDEVINVPLERSLTAESYAYALKIIEQSLDVARTDPRYNLRFRVQQPCKDGRIIDVEAVAAFIRNSDGTPSGILGISRDISTHVKIEEQSEFVKLLLREFEENAGDWLWEIDSEGRLTYVSIRLAHLFHKTNQELLGKHLVELIESTFVSADEDDMKRLRAFSRRLRNPTQFREFMLTVHLENHQRWWMLTGKPLVSRNGELQGWRGVGRDVTERKLHEEETERQANIDSLTGLANRYYMHKFFQGYFIAVDRYVSRCALLHFAIDNLKIINAIFGHATGETIIQKIAERMRKISHKKEVLVARISREEFAAFFMNPAEDFSQEALQFIETVCMPVTIGNEMLDVRASSGFVVFPDATGDSEVTPERLFQWAEMAFGAAKDEGSHIVRAYDRELSEHELHRLAIINELGKALERNEFRLVYQPQISVLTGRIIGVESLIRWESPLLGSVSPSEFIPLAEQNGMMVEIGKWILFQACRDAILWPFPLHVAVNVSSGQFLSNSFLDNIALSLEQTNLATHRLKLEITESSFIGNSEHVKTCLRHLRGKGIKIALDDFGTGYSSLSYLRHFPIDELKIDQSFVKAMERDPGSIAIVETIIRLAKTLNLSTTAEGVETQFEAEYLKHFGCDHFQGFLYNKPVSHEQIMALKI